MDTQAIGYTGRLIAIDLGFETSRLGLLFSASLGGAALGAFGFGPLADRYGRKRQLLIAMFVIALGTFATLVAATFDQLLAWRVLAGIGLGGAAPCFIALAVDHALPNRKSTVASLLYAAFPLGGMIGALVSAKLLPVGDWRSVLWFCGLTSVALMVVLQAALPQSSSDLLTAAAQRDVRRDDISAPGSSARAGKFLPPTKDMTALLCILFPLAFTSADLLALWTAPLLQSAGVAVATTGIVIAACNLGAVLGSSTIGLLIDRMGMVRALLPSLGLAMIGWVLLGVFPSQPTVLIALGGLTGLTGLFVGAASTGMIAVASALYPPSMRGRGIGGAMASGRIGQALGPIAIGTLVALHYGVAMIFIACALPSLLAIGPLLLLGRLSITQAAPTFLRKDMS